MAELTPEQQDDMRRAAHRALRETAGNVHLITVNPQPTGERCPLFTVLSMDDGQRCIVVAEGWTKPGSSEGERCVDILNEERSAYMIAGAS